MSTATVNGEAFDLDDDGITVATLVSVRAESPRGIAVAVNGAVVPRSRWADVVLRDGDRVELLAAAQGG